MSTPCIEMLFTQLPTARLCLIAPKSILELFSADSRIYACFEDSTKQAKNRLKATWQLGRAIRARLECDGGIDIGITLTNHFYSALLLFAAGTRVRVGYKRGLGNVFLTHKLGRVGGIHQVESYVRLIDLALGEQGRVGFLAKNGDCCGESALITTQGKSLDSPCKAPFLAQKSCREDMEPESQNGVTRQAENKIGECEKSPFSSLRADNGGAAIHNKKTQPLESTFENNANKTHKVTPIFAAAKNMDCHAVQAVLAMTEKEAENKKVDSRKNAQSVFDNHAAGGRISLKEHQQCQSDSSPQAESPKQNEDFGESTTHIPPLKLHTKPLDSSKSRKHLRIGLNPGAAYGSAKCWDKEHYACVGAYFAAMGAEVVIYGVEADRQLAEAIITSIDSVLGSHSADLANFEATADHKSSSAPKQAKRSFFRKFAKNHESNTAMPRIFEEESRASLRDTAPAVARQSTHNAQKSKKVDSSMDSKETSAQPKRYPLFCGGEPAVTYARVCALDSPCKAPFLAQNKQSEVSLEKPTPQTKKAQSTSAKPTLEQTPKIINACGKTTIPTLLQDLQALDLFITNDSGSMHIAAALGVPMVAIFGPTNMRETAPWRARDCALLNLNLPCAPCKKRVCPLGHHKCMKDLRPEMVIEAALAILHKPKLSK
ncbi:glycosyltransferase family 9 protein [Helicobacter zhangjianzhongii]|uniref:Uncharacterized protein n=1 Tax=Helicobacter zhangjianzhongii TaxID=2974574 RepID=A0ACC6FQG3_9HELI|nr:MULTISPECIES: glycosyltransferase family 9 protein [unclassified Helicobacter]MDL0079668.1 hypothetical protein [Helicobacter sp. CPD2-1]MDL0081435.1 hypothetical protein [Helicobacter sp. XJK30-2]